MQRADNFVPRLSTWRVALTMAIAVTGVVCGSRAQTLRPGDRAPLQTSTHMTQVPARPFDVVLARPTDRSVTLSLRSTQSRNIAVFYGHAGGTAVPGPTIALAAGVPGEAVLGDLVPDAEYSFELRAADGMAEPYTGRFHTQRLRGQSFTFTITADSHLDAGTRAELYARTLTNIAADRPDFHVDLGDTFMTEKYESGFKEALPQYLAQRYWFGLLRAPLFLALGNHDGESGIARRPQDAEMSLWSAQMRTALFPNPEPGVFFSGNARPLPGVGLLQNYYAFEWGDAQIIVLDPFWAAARAPGNRQSGWDSTLGREQYDWLAQTLAGSSARYRFVFIHHLVGGNGSQHRGGVEFAGLFEWGGLELDGRPAFAARRPGWALPIHSLLVKHHVTAVFHGHDHLYARQELDGITYQAVPQPSHPENRGDAMAREYGYVHGDILASPGHLRVAVAPNAVTVDYVRAVLDGDRRTAYANGAVGHSYRLPPP